MKLLDIVHPAARTLVDIARSQDAEVTRAHTLTLTHRLAHSVTLYLTNMW